MPRDNVLKACEVIKFVTLLDSYIYPVSNVIFSFHCLYLTVTSLFCYMFCFLGYAQVLYTGFLQVRENWKKSGNLLGQGKSGKTLQFEDSTGKVRENESTC